MMLYFITMSQSVQTVTLHFFEAGHGQSEGDAVYSTIERAINQVGELSVPSQLIVLCKMAPQKTNPSHVTQVF